MSNTPVVTINTEAGPVRIDRHHFNPEIHTLADKQDDDFEPFTEQRTDTAPLPLYDALTGAWLGDGEPPAPPAPPVPPVTPPAPPVMPPAPPAPPVTPPAKLVEAFVTKNGDKWVLADAEGKSVDGVDYDTKKAASDALDLRNKPVA